MTSDPATSSSPLPPEAILYAWWHRLHPNTQAEDDARQVLRGDAAVLRRAKDFTSVVLTPAYHRIRQELARHGHAIESDADAERLAALAMVLPIVRRDVPGMQSVGKVFGAPTSQGKALLSESRFIKLIHCERYANLTTQLRRTLPIMREGMPVKALIDDIWRWNARVRAKWAEDYYDAIPLLP